MLNVLLRQSWFVLLMVFTMSCATVSVASAKTMHLDLVNINSAPCAEQMHQAMQQHDLRKYHDHRTVPTDTHCKNISPVSHPIDCVDCSFSACQNMMTWLYLDPIQIENQNLPQVHQSYSSTFIARHLTGFWQEILRPPKA